MNMAEAEKRFRIQDWMPLIVLVLSLSVGGITGWLAKVDDRVFQMASSMVMDDDIKDLRREMANAQSRTRIEMREDLQGMENRLTARIREAMRSVKNGDSDP